MNGAVVAGAAEVLPRPRAWVVWQSAVVLWLPACAPFALGPLHDCGHCAAKYGSVLPIVPGVLVPVLANLQDAGFFVAGALVTLGLFGVLYLGGRELPRGLLWGLRTIVALGVAAQGIGLAFALRA